MDDGNLAIKWHTDKLAFPEQLQVCPEDVVDVVWHKLDEVVVWQLAKLHTSEIKLVNGDTIEAELSDGPLQPELHLLQAPVHRIYQCSHHCHKEYVTDDSIST